MKLRELFAAAALPPMLLGAVIALNLGCENKEKVLDIETPNRDIEVTRDRDSGAVDVDAVDKDDKLIDIDTPGADVNVNRDGDGTGVDVDAN